MSEIVVSSISTEGKLFEIREEGKQMARCYLYLEYDGQDKPLGHIVGLFVSPQKRNQGYGTRVLRAAQEAAMSAECRALVGNVSFGEEGLRRTVEKMGFILKGETFRFDLP